MNKFKEVLIGLTRIIIVEFKLLSKEKKKR